MAPVLEDVPRISIATIKDVAHWDQLRADGGGAVVVEGPAGDRTALEISLTTDVTDLGTRWWLRCRCGSRRRFLHLHRGRLACRRCLGLRYHEQLLPDSRWRRDVARPLLRLWRRQGTGSKGPCKNGADNLV